MSMSVYAEKSPWDTQQLVTLVVSKDGNWRLENGEGRDSLCTGSFRF